MTERAPAVVDLFCGVGGLSYGFARAGLNVVAGVDNDPSCEYPYRTNVGAEYLCKSIEDISADDLLAMYPDDAIRVLVGCAPCQPFSTYNQGRGEDDKWTLLREFSRLIEETRPHVLSMENVWRLTRHDVFQDFGSTLEGLGYHVVHEVLPCAAYGVPQTRKRLVLLASRMGEIRMPEPTHSQDEYVTAEQAIGHLPSLEAGETHLDDPLHHACSLSPLNMRRMRATPEGGGWGDWPDELRADCHRRVSGKTYPSVYGRMRRDDVPPTVTTQFHGYGNGRYGHWEQDRAISIREGAILQTFPDDYEFLPPGKALEVAPVARHIGNAVPVRLAEAVAQSILGHLGDVA
jgi:DNA (cytosine-5)-methyltransferase 1